MKAIAINDFGGPEQLQQVERPMPPITDEQVPYLTDVALLLREKGVRVEIDDSDDRMQKKIRTASKQKIPFVLLAGATETELLEAAERADWAPPRTLTAVLLPQARARGAMALLDARTLAPAADVAAPGAEGAARDLRVLLVPDAQGRNPNGSYRHIAGITNERGNVVGLMPHPEHAVETGYGPSLDGRGFFTSILKHTLETAAKA